MSKGNFKHLINFALIYCNSSDYVIKYYVENFMELTMNITDDKKKKRFKLFDLNKDGKGISKKQASFDPGFKGFFISYKNNFNKLVSVNMFMVIGNFPLLFLIINLSGYFKQEYFIPFSDLYQNLAGVFTADGGITPYKMTMYALEGLQHQTLAPTVVTYIFYGLAALTLFTFGLVNVGTAYIIRNMVKGEPIFVWSDFWYSVKRNWKQALPFGVIDCAICGILIWNLYSLVSSTAEFFASMMFWSNIIIFIVYFFMRYYMYVQMVTFKLSVFKMLKNSLSLALLGLKRNVCALLGIVILIFLEILFLFGTGGILIPVAVIAPLTMLFSTAAYMKIYAAFPKIKQYMIDPYLEEHPEEKPSAPDVETIMSDDVSEKERLEEIKKRNNIRS